MLAPPLGSLLSPMMRANLSSRGQRLDRKYSITLITHRSKQFPTAMSSVSPKIRYRCCEYAITCEFPPETYSTIGEPDAVISRPVSMSAARRVSTVAG